MNTKGEHLEYIAHKGLFHIDCDLAIFSKAEIEILEKWGHWFTALVSGELKPFTESQERFIMVIKGEMPPSSLEEKAWFKYRGRKDVEKKYGDRLKVKYMAEGDRIIPSGIPDRIGIAYDHYNYDDWYMSS